MVITTSIDKERIQNNLYIDIARDMKTLSKAHTNIQHAHSRLHNLRMGLNKQLSRTPSQRQQKSVDHINREIALANAKIDEIAYNTRDIARRLEGEVSSYIEMVTSNIL